MSAASMGKPKILIRLWRSLRWLALAILVAGGVLVLHNQLLHPNQACYVVFLCYEDRGFHSGTSEGEVAKTIYATPPGWSLNVSPRQEYTNSNGKRVWNRDEEHPLRVSRYWLEYNDALQLHDDAWLARLKEDIASKAQNGPLHVVFFVHGWSQSACVPNYGGDNSPVECQVEKYETKFKPSNAGAILADGTYLNGDLGSDYDAVRFDYVLGRHADQLLRFHELEHQPGADTTIPQTPPEVIGVYIGWRGKMLPGALANRLLSLKDRAATADALGACTDAHCPRRVIQSVSQMLANHADSRILVLGHSLGGRVLTRMVLDKNQVLTPMNHTNGFPVQPLMVAKEIAMAAECYNQVLDPKKGRPTKGADSFPALVLLTSEDDAALRYIMPAGVWRKQISPCDPNADKELRHVAVGKHPRFYTHQLGVRSMMSADSKADYSKTQGGWAGWLAENASVPQNRPWAERSRDMRPLVYLMRRESGACYRRQP